LYCLSSKRARYTNDSLYGTTTLWSRTNAGVLLNMVDSNLRKEYVMVRVCVLLLSFGGLFFEGGGLSGCGWVGGWVGGWWHAVVEGGAGLRGCCGCYGCRAPAGMLGNTSFADPGQSSDACWLPPHCVHIWLLSPVLQEGVFQWSLNKLLPPLLAAELVVSVLGQWLCST
jgi:hypothetical protein